MSAAFALVTALGLATGPLPEGAASYRLEIAGVHVGGATLEIRCAGETCSAAWTTRLRLPEEAGGDLAESRVVLEVGRDGRSRGGAARVERDGKVREVPGVAGAVPAMIAPLVLLAQPADGCAEAYDEETGARGSACTERSAGGLRATVLSDELRITPSGDGFPSVLDLAAQRARWARVEGGMPPPRAPRLFGVRVGAGVEASTFCGLPPDPPPPPVPTAALPHPAGAGASCREIALDYLARAGRQGLEGRVAVGVAWTGDAFAWHAWVEVRRGEVWIPVDPTFGQLPALGPRFTLARYAPDDPAERLAAGRRVLRCWGERAR